MTEGIAKTRIDMEDTESELGWADVCAVVSNVNKWNDLSEHCFILLIFRRIVNW